jgi:hypothetical protein
LTKRKKCVFLFWLVWDNFFLKQQYFAQSGHTAVYRYICTWMFTLIIFAHLLLPNFQLRHLHLHMYVGTVRLTEKIASLQSNSVHLHIFSFRWVFIQCDRILRKFSIQATFLKTFASAYTWTKLWQYLSIFIHEILR